MKPVSETPTEPRDYAAISLAYGTGLAALAATAVRRRNGAEPPLGAGEIVPLGAATFALSKTISKEKAGTWLREPVVDQEHQRPKGRRLRYAAGELLTCSRCVGAWSALGLVGLRVRFPTAGRAVTSVLAASALNDFLQTGFTWMCSRANQAADREGRT